MKKTVKYEEILEENKKLTNLFEDYCKNPRKGTIDKSILDIFLFKAVNQTLRWVAKDTDSPPSEWIIDSLIKWTDEQNEK